MPPVEQTNTSWASYLCFGRDGGARARAALWSLDRLLCAGSGRPAPLAPKFGFKISLELVFNPFLNLLSSQPAFLNFLNQDLNVRQGI